MAYKILKKYIKENSCNIYIPVVVNGELIHDGNRRKLENQHIRLNLFPDMTGESILDVGFNSGYILFQLKKKYGGECTGIDNDKNMFWIAQKIKEIEKLDVNLYLSDFNNIDLNIARKYDNVLYLGLTLYVGILKILPKLLMLAKKRVIIEPANHEGKSKEEIKKYVKDLCNLEYKAKLLGFTDYQHRGLIQIDKKEDSR